MALFINRHITQFVLYLLRRSRMLLGYFKIKLASRGLSTGLPTDTEHRSAGRGSGSSMPMIAITSSGRPSTLLPPLRPAKSASVYKSCAVELIAHKAAGCGRCGAAVALPSSSLPSQRFSSGQCLCSVIILDSLKIYSHSLSHGKE